MRWAMAVFMLGLGTSCAWDARRAEELDRDPPPLAEAVIGAEGGELVAPGVRMRFPPGALARDTRITVRRVSPFRGGSPGPVFDMGPSGTHFAQRPEMTLDLPESACRGSRGFVLATEVDGRWERIPGSRQERGPCRVVGEVAHFSHFGTLPDRLPLDPSVQNHLLEAVLWGRYHYRPRSTFREYRSDGLLTVGTSRFVRDPEFCLIGYEDDASGEIRATVRAILADAVAKYSDDHLRAVFPDSGCPTNDTVFALEPACEAATDPTQLPLACRAPRACTAPNVAANRVNVFLENVLVRQRRRALGLPWAPYPAGPQGIACYTQGLLGFVRGDELSGGILLLMGRLERVNTEYVYVPLTLPLTPTEELTVRHELGHVFGLEHYFGDPGIVNYREETLDLSPLQLDAYAALYQLEPGLGLRDLIALGVIEDRREILDEPPELTRTSIWRGTALGGPADSNHGSVGEEIYVVGQRLSLGLAWESTDTINRPLGYAPPEFRFGAVSLVPNIDILFQSFGRTRSIFAGPSGSIRLNVPTGAGNTLEIRHRGWVATLPAPFTVDPASAPNPGVPDPPTTPLPVTDLACPREGETVPLTWALPATYADGVTPLRAEDVDIELWRNGVQLTTPPITPTGAIVPDGDFPEYESSLYQVFLVDRATRRRGIPSRVCTLEPRVTGSETTLFLIDRTGSMNEPRADGITRYQAAMGPLLPPHENEVPRAFAALDEVFRARQPPRVAVYSFNATTGVVDEVREATGSTFTTDYATARDVLVRVRDKGALSATTLVDSVCISARFVLDEHRRSGTARATLRIFTDGKENFSVGVTDCPTACRVGTPGGIEWNDQCRPGTCPPAFPSRDPLACSQCQLALFRQYCGAPANFFVEYFGPAGPFSPLPPDAAYFMDLAASTHGGFVWNPDTGGAPTLGVPGDLPPVANAGEPETVECTGPAGARVLLTGTALDDRPHIPLEYVWSGPFAEGGGVLRAQDGYVTLARGAHMLRLVVSDEHQDSTPDAKFVSIVDTQAPELAVTLTPTNLWSPNRTLRQIVAAVTARDRCDAEVQVRLVSIVPSDGASGDDVAGADVGTDDRTFWLRAERTGAGTGRSYVVTYEAEDDAGNRVQTEAVVRVAHDQR